MGDAKQLRRNFLWNTFGQIIYMVCHFLFGILILSLAGAEQSGIFTTAISATGIFLSIASYGMYNFQVSDAHEKYTQSCYIRSRAYTVALASAVCMVFTLTGVLRAENAYSALQCACILLYHAYRMVESVTDVYNAISQKAGRLDLVGKTYALRGLVTLAVFVGVLAATHQLLLTLVLMLGVNIAMFCTYTLRVSRGLYHPQPVEKSAVRALLFECAPLAVYTALSTTAASLPKIVLQQQWGNSAIGIYGPVTQPVLLLQTGATYLFIPFINVFTDSYAAKDKKGFWKAVLGVQAVVLALLPAGLLVAHFLGEWGLETFVGSGMGVYQYLLAPMVVSAVLTALVLFYSMVLTVMRCMKALIAANVCGIVAAYAVSEPFIQRWELQGTTYAAIAALAMQLVFLAVSALVLARRYFSTQGLPKPEDPFDGLPS